MRYRSGVVIAFPDGPKMQKAKNICDRAYLEIVNWPDALITSQHDGNHSINSKHYARLDDLRRYPCYPNGSEGAIDLRTWPRWNVPGQMLPATKERIAKRIRELLEVEMPGEWWVGVEPDHIHVQHQYEHQRPEVTA